MELEYKNWIVLVIWECQIKDDIEAIVGKVKEVLD